ncbi:MAG: aminomethyltransferase family protein [Desulfobacterales bacterium]|nr:aminomethyltransferase family protein [Desulfobacterales bacterium]
MNTPLKQTPLHEWHVTAGANMADFGGYDMPLWYETGVKTEHLAVLTSAGIFDTSHMACISVIGDPAFELLNYCFTRDLGPLKQGRCVYGAFLNADGHCIDDAIVYKFSDTCFMICVNAGMGAAITRHLEEQKSGRAVEITDLSGKIAKVDIQGFNSARILSRVIRSPEKVFNGMPYFSFKGHFDPSQPSADPVSLNTGTPVLLSRSGYTGEFGFEIFISPDAVVELWTTLLTQGKSFGITTCGLGARDSLRAGACLPLSHQDIGDYKFMNHPWEFALPYTEDKKGFSKAFLGDTALIAEPGDLFVFPFAGDTLRKVAAGEETGVYDSNNARIGHVLTCATDMGTTWHDNRLVSIATPDLPDQIRIKGISCGFVMVNKPLEKGTRLRLTEGKRSITVTVVSDVRPDRTARKKLSHFI